ncbi:unnamed protein product [Closterium sp. Yama58-4]|nr:unnamed protein product [Closterium sp. Yama58-4]
MGCFVDQGATSVRIEACGQVLDIFQSPSCLADPVFPPARLSVIILFPTASHSLPIPALENESPSKIFTSEPPLGLSVINTGTRLAHLTEPDAQVRPGVTGSVLWDSGVVLAKALEHLADSARLPIRGASIVAALLGASHVHITDQYDRLRLIHRNVCHNLLPSHPLSATPSSLNSSSFSSSSSSSSSFPHGPASSARHASAKKASNSSASAAGSASGGGGGAGGKRRGGAGKAGSAAAATAGQRGSIGDGGMGVGGGDSGAWPEVVEVCHGRKGEETRVRVRVFELEWGEGMALPGFDGEEDESDSDGRGEDEADEEEDEDEDEGEEEGWGGRGREWGEQEQEGKARRRGYDYVVASDVVFSEEGVEVLMQALRQLVRPHTTVLIAGELRNDEVLQLFLERAQARFTVGRLQDRHLHPDFISRRVVVYCLARKRRRQATGSEGR